MDIEFSHSGQPHEALFFVLAYLSLFELLSMNQVCRLIRDAINNDILPWLNIMVQKPLNFRVTDDLLMKIASKANGRLTSLALIDCVKITDNGLLQLIAQNPRIDKLYVPGCISLTPQGVIGAVKMLTTQNHKLSSLRISGIHNIEEEHLEIFHSLIGSDNTKQQQKQDQKQKQRHNLYHKRMDFQTLRTEGTDHCTLIDVEACPNCEEVRAIFDCPRETCERKIDKLCRGCHFCIPRCEECGKCVLEPEDQGETACPDKICLHCWLQLPKCSFCNKAYCSRHVEEQQPWSQGFLCSSCYGHVNMLGDRGDD